MSSFLNDYLDCFDCSFLIVMTFIAILSYNSYSIASYQIFFISAPMMRYRCCSSQLRNWYSYLRSFVWSNSEILRKYQKKRSTLPKTQRYITFLTVDSTDGRYPLVILQAPFMQVNPTQKKMSPQHRTAILQSITFHFSHFSYAIITRRQPPQQKTNTGKQAQKPSQYHQPVDRQLKTEKKPMIPATRTGISESSMKYSLTTSSQGAICRLLMTAMVNPPKTKMMMSFPLSQELTPRSSRMQALRQVRTMGMLRLRKQKISDWLRRSRWGDSVMRWCLIVYTLCRLYSRRFSYSSSTYSSQSGRSAGGPSLRGAGRQ